MGTRGTMAHLATTLLQQGVTAVGLAMEQQQQQQMNLLAMGCSKRTNMCIMLLLRTAMLLVLQVLLGATGAWGTPTARQQQWGTSSITTMRDMVRCTLNIMEVAMLRCTTTIRCSNSSSTQQAATITPISITNITTTAVAAAEAGTKGQRSQACQGSTTRSSTAAALQHTTTVAAYTSSSTAAVRALVTTGPTLLEGTWAGTTSMAVGYMPITLTTLATTPLSITSMPITPGAQVTSCRTTSSTALTWRQYNSSSTTGGSLVVAARYSSSTVGGCRLTSSSTAAALG